MASEELKELPNEIFAVFCMQIKIIQTVSISD